VDTLSKSKKDAEEERNEAVNSAAEHKPRGLEWCDEEGETLDYMEGENDVQVVVNHQVLDSASVERYLTYDNPVVTSFTNHAFVSAALFVAKALAILPNNRTCSTFFSLSTSDPQQNAQDPTQRSFRIPHLVSERQASHWKEVIGEQVVKRRQFPPTQALAATMSTEVMNNMVSTSSPSFEIAAHINTITPLARIQSVIQEVGHTFQLNKDQRKAYDIYLRPLPHLLVGGPVVSGYDSDNRCMYLGGPGGTGKSRVIQAITEAFTRLQCRQQLLISATTGVAANLIGGSTIDSLAKIKRRTGRYKENDDVTQSMDGAQYSYVVDNTWMSCNFLILDEVSMLGCNKLTKISQALQKNKSNCLAFGGIHVLFSGDFFQLPAIGDISLFHQPCNGKYDVKTTEIGMSLWRNIVKTTVLLTEHYRAPNPTVYEVMERLRKGALLPKDIERIKSRVFGHPDSPDPEDPKWQDAPLITPRNNIRQAWNNQAAVRYSIRNNTQMFVSPSIDSGVRCNRNTMIWTGDHKTEMLATWNILCIGATALVTANIAVELNMANGSKVVIREVVPHPEDHEGWRRIHTDRIVRLSRPPIAVWVESTSGPSLEEPLNLHPDLQNCAKWFPIMATKQSIAIPKEYGQTSSTRNKSTFERIQIPLTCAFAMSDFRVQGNGLKKAIFDLKKPPSGRLLAANIYVMLSRVSNWEDLAILRPFEDSVLSGHADPELTTYEQYLSDMNRQTECREERTVGN